jgi:hypothetical protein
MAYRALVSYNFSKSSDTGSSDTTGLAAASVSQIVLPPLSPSDFDLRHSVAGAVSYEVASPAWNRVATAILKGWAVDGLVRASSAPPINVTTFNFSPVIGFYLTQANIVPGQPTWIADSTQPSGKALNPAAFSTPAAGVTGNFPRNGLSSPYSIDQTDLAVRRRFNLRGRAGKVKKVKTMLCTFVFSRFRTLWETYSSEIKRDKRNHQEKSSLGKNTKSGGSDPTFSASRRPKSSFVVAPALRHL